MTPQQLMVAEFHLAFGATMNTKPTYPSDKDIQLRTKLIHEEWREFHEARNLVRIADALADLLYVVNGAGVCYGIDLEPIFKEVHRSNMTKLWTANEVEAELKRGVLDYVAKRIKTEPPEFRDFVVKDRDGKVIKSPSYSPADIALELRKQGFVE